MLAASASVFVVIFTGREFAPDPVTRPRIGIFPDKRRFHWTESLRRRGTEKQHGRGNRPVNPRYGAGLSVLAIFGAILSILVGDPLSPLIFPLGFFGPLSGFYFIGAALQYRPRYRVLGEELMRGVVWYGGCILGWAILLSSTSVLATTAWTVLGLPTVTALGLSLVMVATRAATGLDLKVQTDGGQLLVAITGAIVGGFLVLYAVLTGDWSPWLVVVYVLATVGGLLVWRSQYPTDF